MSGPSHPGRRTMVVRGSLVVVLLVVGGGLAYLLATHPPTPDSFYPKCVMYQATGLHCPGCGTGRAVHAALNGRGVQAAAYNPAAVFLLPVVAIVLFISAGRWALGIPTGNRLLLGGRWIALLAATLIAFTVLRNLPWYPFTLLAPHELNAAADG